MFCKTCKTKNHCLICYICFDFTDIFFRCWLFVRITYLRPVLRDTLKVLDIAFIPIPIVKQCSKLHKFVIVFYVFYSRWPGRLPKLTKKPLKTQIFQGAFLFCPKGSKQRALGGGNGRGISTDFDLKVSDPKNPSYLLIANAPEMIASSERWMPLFWTVS